jgi:ribosomal protein L11 methyltransferase
MSSLGFWELAVGVSADLSEGLTNLVWELGALGVVEEEQPGLGARLRAFFPGTFLAGTLEAKVRAYLDGLRALGFEPPTDVSVVPLADENWADAWRAHFTPRLVGRRLLILPPWETPAQNGRMVITIDPGRAFGTGHHGSTEGCLVLLERALAEHRHARVLDVGTGSGILAIAAARLLRARITASDIDARAVEAARGNAQINRAASVIAFVRASGTAARAITSAAPYQLIFANILLGALTRLAVPLRRLTAPGARIVLSGLLPSHANAALAIYHAQGLVLEKRITLDGWVTLVMHRKTKPPRAGKPGRFRR